MERSLVRFFFYIVASKGTFLPQEIVWPVGELTNASRKCKTFLSFSNLVFQFDVYGLTERVCAL